MKFDRVLNVIIETLRYKAAPLRRCGCERFHAYLAGLEECRGKSQVEIYELYRKTETVYAAALRRRAAHGLPASCIDARTFRSTAVYSVVLHVSAYQQILGRRGIIRPDRELIVEMAVMMQAAGLAAWG